MALTLALPFALSLLLKNVERLSGTLEDASQIAVYLQQNADNQVASDLVAQIRLLPEVAKVEIIAPNEALQQLQQVSELEHILQQLPFNPLPITLQITPNTKNALELQKLQEQIELMPNIEQVQLDLLWIERLSTMLALAENLIFALTLALLLGLLLVVSNTISLQIDKRRAEITVITLIGATASYVRRPFLYIGTFYGFAAGILAWLLVSFSLNWLNHIVMRLAGLYGSDFTLTGVPLAQGFYMVLGASMLGYISAWIGTNRHLS